MVWPTDAVVYTGLTTRWSGASTRTVVVVDNPKTPAPLALPMMVSVPTVFGVQTVPVQVPTSEITFRASRSRRAGPQVPQTAPRSTVGGPGRRRARGQSSLAMVTIPRAVPRVAPSGPVRTTAKVSLRSLTVSPMTDTGTV